MHGQRDISSIFCFRNFPLRIDKGYLRGARILERRFITVIGVLVNNTYSERAYFSLFNDVYIILIGKYFRKL